MKRARSWLAWWGLLVGLWLALVGVWNDPYERIAGYCAAALGATAAEVARAQGVLRFRVEPRWALRLGRPLARVTYEFAIVLVALGRQLRRPRRHLGAFRTFVLAEAAGQDPTATGRRVLVLFGSTVAPNTIAVDADPRAGELEVHELVPGGRSEPPL
jgi:hypothetical protein